MGLVDIQKKFIYNYLEFEIMEGIIVIKGAAFIRYKEELSLKVFMTLESIKKLVEQNIRCLGLNPSKKTEGFFLK